MNSPPPSAPTGAELQTRCCGCKVVTLSYCLGLDVCCVPDLTETNKGFAEFDSGHLALRPPLNGQLWRELVAECGGATVPTTACVAAAVSA
ncbi:hypothetical protein WJX73_000775 [Symbiochloris irregularis]|uniref:Uncharacterized protein n=1 Tax=Symbiochloris irregularis TaxID=706552 RepID=A0AAW1PRQ9_9CHLO